MDRARIPGLLPGQRHPDWGTVYRSAREENLPWHLPHLDPDFEKELKRGGAGRGKLLDVGCGLGTQADLLVDLGFEVVATDIAASAIEKAQVRFVRPLFLVDDITRSRLSGPFEVVIDRGCFHVLNRESYADYLAQVSRLLASGGSFLLKVLNKEVSEVNFGPERFSLNHLYRIFSEHFHIIRIHRTRYFGSTKKAPSAWFVVMRSKKEQSK